MVCNMPRENEKQRGCREKSQRIDSESNGEGRRLGNHECWVDGGSDRVREGEREKELERGIASMVASPRKTSIRIFNQNNFKTF